MIEIYNMGEGGSELAPKNIARSEALGFQIAEQAEQRAQRQDKSKRRGVQPPQTPSVRKSAETVQKPGSEMEAKPLSAEERNIPDSEVNSEASSTSTLENAMPEPATSAETGLEAAPERPAEVAQVYTQTPEVQESVNDKLSDYAKEYLQKIDQNHPEGKKQFEALASFFTEIESPDPDPEKAKEKAAQKLAELNKRADSLDEGQRHAIKAYLKNEHNYSEEEVDNLFNRADEAAKGMSASAGEGGEYADTTDAGNEPLPSPIKEGEVWPTPREQMSEGEADFEAGMTGDEDAKKEAIGKLEKMIAKLTEGLKWAKDNKGTIALWTVIGTFVIYVYLLNKVSGGLMKAGQK